MKRLFANNARGKLNAGITNVATSLTLQGGQGALFPTTDTGKEFHATLVDSSGNVEIIKVTQHNAGSDTFQVVERGQEGTVGLAFDAGDKVELRLTKEGLEAFVQVSPVETIAGDVTLDYEDVCTQKVVTATANITLPPSADLDVGDYIDFKSVTTGNVRLTPQGADTIDAVNALWRLPSFCDCRLQKTAAGAYTLVRRPPVEIGAVEFWPVNSANPPQGYLFADEQAISRTTYAGLFAVYSTTHGNGDGATTFNKPDMRGRVPAGLDNLGGNAASRLTNTGTDDAGFDATVVGGVGGNQFPQLHNHGVTDPGHDHGSTDFFSGGGGANRRLAGNANVSIMTGVDSDTTGISIQNKFTGESGNVQPTLVGNWIVKT